jgi:hypothetical protein
VNIWCDAGEEVVQHIWFGSKHTTMARHKKKKRILPKDVVSPSKKPEDFLIADSAIWWEANPDKSKKYGKKDFRGKEFLTPKEAEIFLEVTGNWLVDFMQGKNEFPKLPYSWDGHNPATVKFARTVLVEYRKIVRARKFSTKARPQNK